MSEKNTLEKCIKLTETSRLWLQNCFETYILKTQCKISTFMIIWCFCYTFYWCNLLRIFSFSRATKNRNPLTRNFLAIYFLKRFLARGFEFVLKMYTKLINGNLGESFKKVFSKFEVFSSFKRFYFHFSQIRISEISSKMDQTSSYLQNWILYGFSPKWAVLKMYSTVLFL